jgi:hypothetical protein
LVTVTLVTQVACAQSLSPDSSVTKSTSGVELSSLVGSPSLPPAPVPSSSFAPALSTEPNSLYTPPTERQKFDDYAWNAVGPVAFAGAAFAGAIDQGFDFQHSWGQGWNAYGVRVASNLGISVITATSQYSIAEVLHEDTAYYRCTCAGFGRRFVHAAISSVSSRRGDDGHREFSAALTASPFIGPMVAANTWIPTHNGLHLGFSMGEHNLMGQFAQDEALEFVYGGPHTLLGRLQRHIKRFSNSAGQ